MAIKYLILVSLFSTFASSQSLDFTYLHFNSIRNLILQQDTFTDPSGALGLTNAFPNAIGHVFYDTPIPIHNATTRSSSSFSTKFVFAIRTPSGRERGYGLAFTMSPAPEFPGGQDGHYLGVLNSFNNGNTSNHVFAVEFDTVSGFGDSSDSDGSHVGLNSNSISSFGLDAPTYNRRNETGTDIDLNSGELIQAWIDYNGTEKVINVTIAPTLRRKPTRPLMSATIDLTNTLTEEVYIGFSAATGSERASSHYILGLSFSLNGTAEDFETPDLPILPQTGTESTSFNPSVVILIVSLCVITVLLLLTLLGVTCYRRRMMNEPSLEAWELECPHRFKYKDLYKATKGFKKTEVVGAGGFGQVYKGIVHSTGSQTAVKKITTNNPLQGVREFVAEIESLGRLRHKNLVNLQGWCKKKNDMLLVYDYVPNGSLHSLLMNPRDGIVLTWEQRFKILKGVASGLLYLHEDWEQVVVHRDIKSSNVLIDSELNGKLGDFGLARLYDHGQRNSQTTNVVGTIGYIAPELTQTGKASTCSDVFAFGVLLLEVLCGRGPIVRNEDGEHVVLADWVIRCVKTRRILDLVDPRLEESYVKEEVEVVFGLGLVCSHSRPEARPTMRQIVKYLNGDEKLNVFHNMDSTDSSRHMDEISSRFLERVSSDVNSSSSFSNFSIGDMSSTSLNDGR